jgi:hypothetical protein
MHIIHNKDKRSGITYAYESISYWDKELKKTRSKRTLIGRVDKDTGEIVPTDGRNRKHSPYQKIEKTRRDEIMDRIRPMGLAALRKEVIRLELAMDALKEQGNTGGAD